MQNRSAIKVIGFPYPDGYGSHLYILKDIQLVTSLFLQNLNLQIRFESDFPRTLSEFIISADAKFTPNLMPRRKLTESLQGAHNGFLVSGRRKSTTARVIQEGVHCK